jgi:Transposase
MRAVSSGASGKADTRNIASHACGVVNAATATLSYSGQRLYLAARFLWGPGPMSVNAATKRIGQRIGIMPDTLRNWAKRHRIDGGQAAGTTTADAERIKKLERENRELRWANEILLVAGYAAWPAPA